ncbi:MAG: hypothetical protein ABUS47_06190 [Steroidobacter sp.]
MKLNLIVDALARAFGMFVFVVVTLWMLHRAFPSRWLALAVLYMCCVPLAAMYGLLVGPQSNLETAPRRYRVSGLLVIGIAVSAVAIGHFVYQTEIEEIFYGIR